MHLGYFVTEEKNNYDWNYRLLFLSFLKNPVKSIFLRYNPAEILTFIKYLLINLPRMHSEVLMNTE